MRGPVLRMATFAMPLMVTLMVDSAGACEHPSHALPTPDMPHPWTRVLCNTQDAFSHENLALQVATIPISFELSRSGADHEVRVFLAENVAFKPFSRAMVLAGYFVVPASALLLYGAGLVLRDRKLAGAGAAAVQALALSFAATTVLKVMTGRPYPNHGGSGRDPERLQHPEWAQEWKGPTLANQAWPSGHTATAVALASSLTSYYVETRWLQYALYPAAGAMGFAMLSGEHHWLSDVAAGAVLGFTIGSTVGENFRHMTEGHTQQGALQLAPGPGAFGVSAVGSW